MGKKVLITRAEYECREAMKDQPKLIEIYRKEGEAGKYLSMDDYSHRNPPAPQWDKGLLTMADAERLLRKHAPSYYEVGAKEHVFDPTHPTCSTPFSQPYGYMWVKAPGRYKKELAMRKSYMALTEAVFVDRWVTGLIKQAREMKLEDHEAGPTETVA